MSPPRRSMFLAAAGVAIAAVFAVLPAPRVIFRRSPTVADRLPGDVRRVRMVIEDGTKQTGTVHVALEVWTDSDWDVEYWSSIPALTPKAVIVTNDGIEQRDVDLSIRGARLAMAWIDVDAKRKTYALRVTRKGIGDRTWAKPTIVESGSVVLSQPSVAVTEQGVVSVAYVRAGALTFWDSGNAHGARPLRISRATSPRLALTGDRVVIAFLWDGDRVAIAERRGGADFSVQPRLSKARARALAVSPPDPLGKLGAVPSIAWIEERRRSWMVEATGSIQGTGVSFDPEATVSLAIGGKQIRAIWGRAGIVEFQTERSGGVLETTSACCHALATTAQSTWFAWLQSRRGAVISHVVRLRYEGPPGPFTAATTIPVTALANAK